MMKENSTHHASLLTNMRFLRKRHFFARFLRLGAFCLAILFIVSQAIYSQSATDGPETKDDKEKIHRPFDILLQIYVDGNRFDYRSLYRNKTDLKRLHDYVEAMEVTDPSAWEEGAALAYWINLYNAATLKLILDNYPLKSIKDLGGFFSSPWKKKILIVNNVGELSLDEVEHDIIRARFKDARIHFALNCASISCPPLRNRAFYSETLDSQLDEAVRKTLEDEAWMKISEKEIRLTKIFDWYDNDFQEYKNSTREFIASYFPKLEKELLDENRKIKYFGYNWKLNKVE